ncbi:MAG: hypothetical protein PHY94_02755 [Candidatus Omnitrophica bacterium]|nr:hypothetical protein [Candidatus Omnitrophota bacterium]
MDKQELKNLKKRYLVWFYKTSKEALDKIERKFTQLEIDNFILKELKKENHGRRIDKFIEEFKEYIRNKESDSLGLKYEGKEFKPEYLFLLKKLKAVEKAIIKELGKKALAQIRLLYEMEMTERILKSTEH